MPTSANDNGAPAPEARPCPICRKPATARYRPFCSKRCADVDLGRWLKGSYAVPAEEAEEPDADAQPRPARHDDDED